MQVLVQTNSLFHVVLGVWLLHGNRVFLTLIVDLRCFVVINFIVNNWGFEEGKSCKNPGEISFLGKRQSRVAASVEKDSI